jgi:hypothetical protein
MLRYRLYLRRGSLIVARQDFDARNAATASAIASVVCEICSDACGEFEIWQASRRLDQGARGGSLRTLDDLDREAQAQALNLLYDLRRGTWFRSNAKLADVFEQAIRARTRAVVLGSEALPDLLGAAIRSTGAHTGNVQAFLPELDGLGIAASQGFARPFLDFFALVKDEGSACSAALKGGERVIVPSVASSVLFKGTEAGWTMLEAGSLSVYSTPIAAGDRLVGMISMHRGINWLPDAEELAKVDEWAARAAALFAATEDADRALVG